MRRRHRTDNMIKFDHYRRRSRSRTTKVIASWFGAAALVGAGAGAASLIWPNGPPARTGHPLTDCRVVDGDTLNCAGERIRLLGIDAPELAGHCRKGRQCAPGDAEASIDSLRDALQGILTIERVGTDRYGRTLALVSSETGDLSCGQLGKGAAIYKKRWDDGQRVARACPQSTR